MHRIVLIGPPASGKGTQGRRIKKLLGVPELGTGALLRREVESGSKLGQTLASYLEQGAYVPDEVMMQLVQEWLVKHEKTGWLLDGFPRTLTQAQALEVNAHFQAPTLAVALDVPQFELERRIVSRRECVGCGATVSVKSEEEQVCGFCGGDLVARSDDGLENFRRRYANYKQQTEPLFDYYAAQGKLLLINGMHSPEEVFAVIENHFSPEEPM